MKNRIMVIEDEQPILDLICMNLEAAGYETMTASDGAEAERLLCGTVLPDLILADIMVPKKDGFELMEVFRARAIPVIYLTARSDVASKVRGLRLGAEDYIVKPFEVLELLIRVEKVLERTGKKKTVISVGDVEVDLASHSVRMAGEKVALKPLEYNLFVLLLSNKNRAFSRDQLLNRIWGSDYKGETRTVDVHIGRLRKKLHLDDVIKTIPKLGYCLEDRE